MAEKVIIQMEEHTHTKKKEEKRNVGKTDGEAWLLLDKLHMKEPFKVADTVQLSIIELETCFYEYLFHVCPIIYAKP
jgi:hypothetical protein